MISLTPSWTETSKATRSPTLAVASTGVEAVKAVVDGDRARLGIDSGDAGRVERVEDRAFQVRVEPLATGRGPVRHAAPLSRDPDQAVRPIDCRISLRFSTIWAWSCGLIGAAPGFSRLSERM